MEKYSRKKPYNVVMEMNNVLVKQVGCRKAKHARSGKTIKINGKQYLVRPKVE